jgi:hypothetical protein
VSHFLVPFFSGRERMIRMRNTPDRTQVAAFPEREVCVTPSVSNRTLSTGRHAPRDKAISGPSLPQIRKRGTRIARHALLLHRGA